MVTMVAAGRVFFLLTGKLLLLDPVQHSAEAQTKAWPSERSLAQMNDNS